MSAPAAPRLARDPGYAPAHEAPAVPAASRHIPWGLILALVLGVVLRLYAATTFPFDQDELYTIEEARDLFATRLSPGIDSRPLYYLLQHPLLSLLPQTEAWLRLLPLLFGVLGIWATWRLAGRVFGSIAGTAAALLLAVSPWHLYASTTARYYSLVHLATVVFVDHLERAYAHHRPRDYRVALGALLVATLTHPSAVFTLVGVALGITLLRRDGRAGWRWPSRGAWVHLWGPYLLALVVEGVVLTLAGRTSAMGNVGSRGLASSLRLLPAMVEWMTPVLFLAGGLGGLLHLRASALPQRRLASMALAGAAVGTALLLLASLRTGVYADYGIPILAVLVVLIGGLVARLGHGSLAPALAVLAVLLAGLAPASVSYMSDGMRFDYRPAYAEIARREPTLAVLTWPRVLGERYAPDLRTLPLRADAAYLDGALARERGLWIVASVKRHGLVEDDEGALEGWLGAHCRRVARYEKPRFDFRQYRVELHRCGAASVADPRVRAAL